MNHHQPSLTSFLSISEAPVTDAEAYSDMAGAATPGGATATSEAATAAEDKAGAIGPVNLIMPWGTCKQLEAIAVE